MDHEIDKYLNIINWKFERINETTIVSGFKGKSVSFTFFIINADEWVIFLTYANLLPIPEEKRGEIFYILAKLNFDTPLVKFSIDDKTNTVVSVELHKSSINETSVRISLESLCSSAENLFNQLSEYQLSIESPFA